MVNNKKKRKNASLNSNTALLLDVVHVSKCIITQHKSKQKKYFFYENGIG